MKYRLSFCALAVYIGFDFAIVVGVPRTLEINTSKNLPSLDSIVDALIAQGVPLQEIESFIQRK